MMSDSEVAEMRTVSEMLLSDTCQILRPTDGGFDADGEPVEAWEVLDTVACSIMPQDVQPSSVGAGGAAVVNIVSWRVRLPAKTPIAASDRIHQILPADSDRYFEVLAIRAPRTIEITRVVICNLLT